MIDLKTELAKYKPILPLDKSKDDVSIDETLDMLEILTSISKQVNSNNKE